MRGVVDITFRVKGRKAGGVCGFKARRLGGKSGAWETSEWTLTLDDGSVMQLLDKHAGDPLAAVG